MTEQTNSKKQQEKSLGLAGGLAKAFIHSPLTPMLLIACFLLGIMGVAMTPRQEDPQISVPMVDVFVRYNGASAQQVSRLATEPLERMLNEMSGVDHVYSAAMRGQGMVTVQFEVGEELESSLVKLYDKISSNMDKIPPGVDQPLVKPKGVDDVPVVTLTLWSNTLDDSIIRLTALDVLQSISMVGNTSQGFVVGGRSDQLKIEVLPERLSGYEISLDQIANTIRTANSELGLGNIESDNLSSTVYAGAFLETVSDIESLVVTIKDGSPVYIRDVAQVTASPSDTSNLVSYYTGPNNLAEGEEEAFAASAVTIAIAKKKGSNGVEVAEDIIAMVDTLRGTVIPDDIHVSVTRDYGESAKNKVNGLILKLFIATAIVVVLIWAALNFRWEPALVVMIVIPVVILATIFYALLTGYTIDRVSLFALIFSIGILVDDAIVVVENIYRRWLIDESTDTSIAIDAVREVGNPTILATFTVIAALLPMGFVRGMMGPYMEPIPALGSFAMLFSVFAAFMFTPWLAMRIKPSMSKLKEMEESEHKQNEWLGNLFKKILIPLITSKTKGRLFLISLFVIFFLSIIMFYTKSVPVKMLPLDNKSEFNVVVNMAEGTALPVTANIVNELAEVILQVDEVTAIQTYAGTASPFNFNGLVRHYYLRTEPWQADLQVQLLSKKERTRSSHEIAEDVRERLQEIIKGNDAVRIQVVEMPPGPPVLQSVVAEVYGPDEKIRRQVARDLEQKFIESPNITDVDTLIADDYKVWRFEVDTEKALRRGISVDTINRTLQMSLGEFILGDVKSGLKLEPTYIIIQVPIEVRADLARLKEMPVPSQLGSSVPLGELGDFYQIEQESIIYHKDLRPVEYVTGETIGRLGAPIYGMFDVIDSLENYTAPDGISLKGTWTAPPDSDAQSGFEWSGEWTVTYETFRDMGMAFGVAIVLIYMLVVLEFGNFSLPAVIMAPIPLTLVGIIPGHWLFGAEFTATSMIGFIALAGIIVRNSILLVDFTKHEVEDGRPVTDSVLLACKARTRPIVVTALALVGGSAVIIFDPIFKGMAISLAFGVLVSTILTLVIIPLGAITVRKSFAEKSLDASGATVFAELPYDPILEGDYTDNGNEDDDSERGVLDYISVVLSFIWIFVISMVVAFRDFSVDLATALIRLLTRKSNETDTSVITKNSANESSENKPQPVITPVPSEEKVIQTSATEKEIEKQQVELEDTRVDEQPVKKKASIKKVSAKKSAVKKGSTKKTVASKPVAAKTTEKRSNVKKAAVKKATPINKSSRRGIRLKSDIDDE
ncbi:MAG: AcrB/AcrD/AcrF family protein [Gammaproteobacteria bacterium]|nr:AcrB/AcrD/AcrF family protein [Gammaproteobacteria bacterium]